MNSAALVRQHLGDVDFVLHVGDISYAVGNGATWDQWFDEVEPIVWTIRTTCARKPTSSTGRGSPSMTRRSRTGRQRACRATAGLTCPAPVPDAG